METLKKILSPYGIEHFFQTYWTEKGIHIPNTESKNFNQLFSWEKLTHLLNHHEFQYPDLRLAVDGGVLGESECHNPVKKCKEKGATLIIDRVSKLIPEVADLVSALRYDLGLGHRVQTNAYCSWPGTKGFPCHFDGHEVFILQVDGTKEWHIFPDTRKYPSPDDKSSFFSPPEEEPYLKCVQKPGDVLYIPRGHWHYAVALDQPSLHLTVGIHVKTGVDFLEWLVDELKQHEEWRKNMPPLITSPESETLKGYVHSLLQNLSSYLANQERIDIDYTKHLASLETPIAGYSLPYQAGFYASSLEIGQTFKIPKFQRTYIFKTGDSCYQIIVGGKEVNLQGVTNEFIENFFSQEFFTGYDVSKWLPGFDWEKEIVPLLSYLLTEGIIFLESDPSKQAIAS